MFPIFSAQCRLLFQNRKKTDSGFGHIVQEVKIIISERSKKAVHIAIMRSTQLKQIVQYKLPVVQLI